MKEEVAGFVAPLGRFLAKNTEQTDGSRVCCSTTRTCKNPEKPPELEFGHWSQVRAVDVLRAQNRWAQLPLVALGASSGGHFVGRLPAFLELEALAIQIMVCFPQTLEGFGVLQQGFRVQEGFWGLGFRFRVIWSWSTLY